MRHLTAMMAASTALLGAAAIRVANADTDDEYASSFLLGPSSIPRRPSRESQTNTCNAEPEPEPEPESRQVRRARERALKKHGSITGATS